MRSVHGVLIFLAQIHQCWFLGVTIARHVPWLLLLHFDLLFCFCCMWDQNYNVLRESIENCNNLTTALYFALELLT